jgi:hypothetical protein
MVGSVSFVAKSRIGARAAECLVFFLLAGCAATNHKVPSWAIHVERPAVDASSNTAHYRARLLRELRQPRLESEHLSGDQICGLAISELRAGRAADAALLLSLASYRYNQQSVRIVDLLPSMEKHLVGMERQGMRIDRKNFYAHVHREVEVMRELDYDEILKSYWIWSDRGRLTSYLMNKTFDGLDAVSSSEAKGELGRLAQQLERMDSGPEPEPRDQHLKDAYLARLLEDSADERRGPIPHFYLAMTPFAKFRDAALEHSTMYLSGPLLRALSGPSEELRGRLLSFLQASRAETRSLAALGLAHRAFIKSSRQSLEVSDEQAREAIGAALQVEADPMARMSMLQALVVLGDETHLSVLEQSIESACPSSKACSHGLLLIDWLPENSGISLDPGFLVSLATPKEADSTQRYFAVRALGRMGRAAPLPSSGLDALLEISDDWEHNELASVARSEVATLPELDAAAIWKRLRLSTKGRSALFLRLASCGEPVDAVALSRFRNRIASFSRAEKQSFLVAIASLPSQDRVALLEMAYREMLDKPSQTHLASLVPDSGPSGAHLAARILAEQRGAPRVVLKVKSGAKDVSTDVAKLLRSGDVFDRVVAAQLAVDTNDRAQMPILWELASYRSDTEYPSDAYVRHAAMQNLFILELRAASERYERAKKLEDAYKPGTRSGL